MQASHDDPVAEEKIFNELKTTYKLFNETLVAFEFGGAVMGADGLPVILQPAKTAVAKKTIVDAKILWEPYSAAIGKVINATDTESRTQLLDEAIQFARADNLTLLGLMNQLTVDLETTATQQATTLRYVQAGGISLAIINFLIILFHFIGELKRNDKALESARKETTDILNTVNEGLFLLDKDLLVGSQHSARLSKMFGDKAISNQAFSDLIGDLVKPKDLETAQRFIGLLFRPDIKSNLIHDLNPLNEVEINLPDHDGGYTTLHLSFQFNRVMLDGELHNILVTVNDITEKVKLTRQLAEEKQRSEQQLEMLTSILHTNPNTLKRFIQGAFDTFGRINNLLKDQSKSDVALKRKLNDIFVEAHNFKGEASARGLETFTDYAHNFEADIFTLKNNEKITGNDFLKLTVQLEKMIRHTESVNALAIKLASFAVIKDEFKPFEKTTPDTWLHLEHLTKTVAERANKQVQLVATGFNETNIDNDTQTLVSDLCIQFIRNAITHSIESPQERIEKGKADIGRIDARLVRLHNGQLELSVRDDGQGINYEKIRQKALASNQWPADRVKSWSHKQLINCIFEAGFSTADDTTADAGRGVGMNVIRDRIKNKGGKLCIATRHGQDCVFTATFPQLQQAQAVA
jgi:signal transduction histidine kinase